MTKMRAALLGTTMIAGAVVAVPAWAIVVGPETDFELSLSLPAPSCTEICDQSGTFTVTNNTNTWWITGFGVTGVSPPGFLVEPPVENVTTATPPGNAWNAEGFAECPVCDMDFGYSSPTPNDLADDLGNGTFTGFDFDIYYYSLEELVDPPAYFDITNGATDLVCNADINFGDGQTTTCNVANAVGVPEPATLSLFGAGLAFFGAMRRRRKAA